MAEAKKNVTIIYHVDLEEPRMVVVDAEDLNDPAWNPEGHAQIPVNIHHFNSLDHAGWQDHIKSAITAHKASMIK